MGMVPEAGNVVVCVLFLSGECWLDPRPTENLEWKFWYSELVNIPGSWVEL